MSEDAAGPATVLVDQLAAALGTTADETLGFSVAIDFRWEVRDRGLFVSGTPADLVERVAAAFGASLTPGGPIAVEAERWLGTDRDAIGFGPVTGTTDEITWRLTPTADSPTALEALQGLRARLLESSTLLEMDLEADPDVPALLAAHAASPEAVAIAIGALASTRRSAGRYLLDAGDLYDDERIDQLGDGYLRVSGLWDAVATRPEKERVSDAIALERACLAWMRGASDPPTRYAF